MAEKFKIKKGDQVIVTTGKDKGKRGEVLRVLRENRRVVVAGANVAKRHTRPDRTRRKRTPAGNAPSAAIRGNSRSAHS